MPFDEHRRRIVLLYGKYWRESQKEFSAISPGILYFISARVISRNSRRRASQRPEIAKFKSAIALPLISRYSARTHTYSNRLCSFSTCFILCASCITLPRTENHTITVD